MSKPNRDPEGTDQCICCGHTFYGASKYPVCFDCAGRMAQDYRGKGYRFSTTRAAWLAEEVR